MKLKVIPHFILALIILIVAFPITLLRAFSNNKFLASADKGANELSNLIREHAEKIVRR